MEEEVRAHRLEAFEEACNRFVRVAKKSVGRASSNPFFAQGTPSSPSGVEEMASGVVDHPFLSLLYSKLSEREEAGSMGYTVMSGEEVRERWEEAKRNGARHSYVDFAFCYMGMGNVRVFSTNEDGDLHWRMDGGANGIEREENAKKALLPREKTDGTVIEFLTCIAGD